MTEGDNTLIDSESNTKYKDGVNRNARLIVRNISFKATDENLKEHFSKYGTVEEVNLLKKPDGRLVGCAFVHYTQVPMANKALAATNKKPFLGRPIYVAWAVPKDKYNVEEQNGKPKKKFNNAADDVKPEIKNEDEENVKQSKEDQNKVRINRNARLIVRNISFKATEDTLKEHFEPYGLIQEVKLLKKPDGKLVGCAFVHFKNVPMAAKALENTNLKPFLGRPISVDWAVAKDKYMRHVVTKQMEMEEQVKKEDSDSDDEDTPLNISTDEVKQEIKSESGDSSEAESDSEHDDVKSEEDDDDAEASDSEDDDSDKDDDDEDEEEDDEDDVEDDNKSVTSTQPEYQRKQLNDAEDGCTVFLTNIPFSVDDDQLKMFAEKTGPVKYALICVDKLTEHSKGSGFIKFVNKEDADRFLALPAAELRLDGQGMLAKPALKRENLNQTGNKKQAKDNRNLYLVKEGVVVAGTKAAVGVSASDMSKRLALERSKTQMLKNLNRFVSRYRLVVSNLPPNYDDGRIRTVCARAGGGRATITEARVMRDLRAPVQRDGKRSKGYGFVMFTRHEDALACLRKLNNNPDIFDKNNRPIVSFSIEDRTALNARKKRLEKSIANNPVAKKEPVPENENDLNARKRKNRKRKSNTAPDESYMKKGRFEKKEQFEKRKENFKAQNGNFKAGQFVRRQRDDDTGEYTGLTAKEGSQHKMRSSHKLRTQADIHRQTVKQEKKNSKRAMRLKMAARERIKLPKQKINKNKTGKRNKKRNFNSDLL